MLKIRLVFIAAILVLGLCPPLSGGVKPESPGNTATSHPNIILVLTDDLDLLLGELDNTPNIKSLLKERGTTFTHFFVPLSLCCPSRSTILTSQFPHNHSVWGNTSPNGGFSRFHDLGLENSTVAVTLHGAGYRTALMGKYLNGYPDPAERTFIPPGWDEWYSPADGNPYSEYNYTLNENGILVQYGSAAGDYLTDVLSVKAVDFIDEMVQPPLAGKPFFLYIATYAPHSPYTPAPRHANLFPNAQAPRPLSFNEADVTDKPAWLQSHSLLTNANIKQIDEQYRLRLRCLQAVDELVATVVQALEHNGQLANTYIFFTSDNGYHMGEHRLASGKYTPFEEDIRVPLIIRGPGVPAASSRSHLCGSVDLTPTFLEMAKVPLWSSTYDGRSMLPLLSVSPPPESSWRKGFFLEQGGDLGLDMGIEFDPLLDAAKSGDWSGVLEPNDLGDEMFKIIPIPPFVGVQTYEYKYIRYQTGEQEFYNRSADPSELENLATTVPVDFLGDLSTWTAAFQKSAGSTLRLLEEQPSPQLAGVDTFTVDPAATDSAIDDWLDPHVVCIERDHPQSNFLFVFLPGSFAKPESYQLVLQEAAKQGIPAIGLRYPNSWTVDDWCSTSTDPDCHEQVRLEIIDGLDRTSLITVSRANCIESRLAKLLKYLAAEHPTDGWGDFLDGDLPRWSRIVIGGHSQGGGHAALIGKVRPVARVVMFSAPLDYSTFFSQMAPWLSAPGLTPAWRSYGFAHHEESGWGRITAAWYLLGLNDLGALVNADNNLPPYNGTHRLDTTREPAFPGEYHGSTAADRSTPKDGSGQPLFAPIWQYLITPVRGDLNGDAAVNEADLAVMAAMLSGGDGPAGECALFDLNDDGWLNAIDLVLLAKLVILGGVM